MTIINILLAVAALTGAWRVFVKAGREGWEAIVPVYNLYALTLMTGQPWWLVVLCLIPFVNLVAIGFLTDSGLTGIHSPCHELGNLCLCAYLVAYSVNRLNLKISKDCGI